MMNWRILLFFSMASAASATEADNAVTLARAARADGVPQAAIHALTQAAKHGGGLPVHAELARCLIAADREKEAVEWLDRCAFRDRPEVAFWRAQALAQEGDYGKALADYARAMTRDFPQRDAAALGRARMLEALGRFDEALDAYAGIPATSAWHGPAQLARAEVLIKIGRGDDAARLLEGLKLGNSADKELRDYLSARLALEKGRHEAAERIYEKLSPKSGRLAAGAAIGRAEAVGSDPEKAEALLESFIAANPESPLLVDLFAKLDEMRAQGREPANATLKLWEKDDQHPARAALASYYLARSDERQGRTERAIRNYTQFIENHPSHALRMAATIRLAQLFLADRQTAAAARILPADSAVADRAERARVRFLRAMVQYQSRDFSSAAKSFVGAANVDPSLSERALGNAALAAIAGSNEPEAAEILNALRKENAAVARRIELAQAFQRAKEDNPDAGEQLAWIAERGSNVGTRARLALAEWKWLGGDGAGARGEFLRVGNSKAAGRTDQRDYFAVYLADDGSLRAVDAVSQAARDFLAGNADSPHEAEVRMKWGEVLMRSGDFRGARQQFEEAARETRDASLRRSAQFFAARAAIASMNPAELDAAIQLLEDVAQEKSEPLATQARIEQAMLQSALGRPKDALAILDSLAKSATDARTRLAIRMKKGETLLAMGGDGQIDAAVAEWRAVAADPASLPAERNEALTRAAAAAARKGDVDAAIAACYEVLTAPRDAQPEFFWYYKAGFDAAQLLVKAKRYKEAAAIYEKMAAAPGPRAAEFKDLLNRLRLENFIWEN
jgi:predicted negative regulator of RcsB-dependent stress response